MEEVTLKAAADVASLRAQIFEGEKVRMRAVAEVTSKAAEEVASLRVQFLEDKRAELESLDKKLEEAHKEEMELQAARLREELSREREHSVIEEEEGSKISTNLVRH